MDSDVLDTLDPRTADLARRVQNALWQHASILLDEPAAVAVARDLEGTWA